jgi:hypothetical protein
MTAMLEGSNRDIVAARTLHNEIKNPAEGAGAG